MIGQHIKLCESFTESNPVVHVTLPQSSEIKLVSEAYSLVADKSGLYHLS